MLPNFDNFVNFSMPAREPSRIWQHFEKRGTEAICKAEDNCKVSVPMRNNNTTGLWRHLEKYHKAIYTEEEVLRKETEKKKGETLAAFRFVKTEAQPLITEVIRRKGPKYPKHHHVQKAVDKYIQEMMTFEGMPFRLVGSEAFQNLVRTLDPRASVHHRTTYSRAIRKSGRVLRKRLRAEVQEKVKFSIGMTADGWESRAGDDYIGSTVHFISNFQLRRLTIACRPFKERHSGNNIGEVLKDELGGLNLQGNTFKVMITDAASNMRVARRGIQGVYELNCCNHQLQLAINDAKDPKKVPGNQDFHDAVDAATKLSNFARKSPYFHKVMKRKKLCKASKHTFTKLKSYSKVRWNSTYQMIKAVVKHQVCITTMEAENLCPSMPSVEVAQWRLLKTLCEVLEPCEHTTKVWESETEPTMSRVAEEVYNLSEKLKKGVGADQRGWMLNSNAEKDPVLRFSEELLKRVEVRFPSYGLEEDLIAWGHLLNPKFKGILLKKTGLFESTIRSLTLLIELLGGNVRQREAVPQTRFEGVEGESPIDILMRRSTAGSQAEVENTEERLKEELSIYDKILGPSKDEDCLKFWGEHSSTLPLLSLAAQAVLAIPCASSSVERVFSAGTKAVSVDRGSLAPASVQSLVLFKSNRGKINMDDLEEDEVDSEEEDDLSTDTESEGEVEEEDAEEENLENEGTRTDRNSNRIGEQQSTNPSRKRVHDHEQAGREVIEVHRRQEADIEGGGERSLFDQLFNRGGNSGGQGGTSGGAGGTSGGKGRTSGGQGGTSGGRGGNSGGRGGNSGGRGGNSGGRGGNSGGRGGNSGGQGGNSGGRGGTSHARVGASGRGGTSGGKGGTSGGRGGTSAGEVETSASQVETSAGVGEASAGRGRTSARGRRTSRGRGGRGGTSNALIDAITDSESDDPPFTLQHEQPPRDECDSSFEI